MSESSASKSEHVYRGWKIRTTDTAVDTKFSARVEVWKPEHDPRSHNGIVVPFLRRPRLRRMHMPPLLTRQRSGLREKWGDRGC